MNALIEKMIKEKDLKGWSDKDLINYIGKTFSIEQDGTINVAGKFSPEELEAIAGCGFMERATPKFG